MIISNLELKDINGGANISGTLLNAIGKLINSIFDIGRSIGSSIRMASSGRKC